MLDSRQTTIAKTACGDLQGTVENGLEVFLGVPYAEPPVGALRFRPPVPATPWTGIRPALRSGPASFQMNLANQARVLELAAAMDPGVVGVPNWPAYVADTYDHPEVDEDCLYMDIWVPAGCDRKLPVYIYYHGGANAVSSGSFHLERGANLARQENVIVVRPNYRLGALGWVHFGLISDALGEAVNLGMQDQIAVLKWVHDNIAAFGGDPDAVTIGGESCGATAVSQLMTNREARRYFKRVILQSLSPFNVWCTQDRDNAVKITRKYLELLRIDDPAALLDVEPERFLAVQSLLTRWLDPDDNVAWRPLGSVVDGKLLPEMPASFLSEGRYPSDLQVMIGFAKDEWQFFRGHAPTLRHGSEADVLRVLGQTFGRDGAKAVYDAFQVIHPDHGTPGHLLSDIMSFEFFKFSSLLIARHLAAQGIPTYVFQFTFDLPGWGGELRAVHTGDMPFLWRNYAEADLKKWPSFDGVEVDAVARTSAAMGELYGSFIRNGDPGAAWPRYDDGNQTILSFGRDVVAVPGMLDTELAAFTAAGPRDVRMLEAILTANLQRALKRQEQRCEATV